MKQKSEEIEMLEMLLEKAKAELAKVNNKRHRFLVKLLEDEIRELKKNERS